jgi:hypothetical protein
VERKPLSPTAKAPGQNFTGDVYVNPLYKGEDPSRMIVSLVRFTPGARTNWQALTGRSRQSLPPPQRAQPPATQLPRPAHTPRYPGAQRPSLRCTAVRSWAPTADADQELVVLTEDAAELGEPASSLGVPPAPGFGEFDRELPGACLTTLLSNSPNPSAGGARLDTPNGAHHWPLAYAQP